MLFYFFDELSVRVRCTDMFTLKNGGMLYNRGCYDQKLKLMIANAAFALQFLRYAFKDLYLAS